MGKLLVRLRRILMYLIARSIFSIVKARLSGFLGQNLWSQAETHLSFAGISRQMKDLNFSVYFVPLW